MTDRNYGAIRDADKLEILVNRLIEDGKPIAIDIEAGYTGEDKEEVSLKQFHPEYILVGISFTNATTWARYVPIAHDAGDNIDDTVRAARLFWRLVQTGLCLAHNLSYEYKGMSRWFRLLLWDDPEVGEQVRASNGMFPARSDTQLEVYLAAAYDPIRVGKGLKGVAQEAFGLKMTEFNNLFPAHDSDMGPGTPRGKQKYIRFNTRYSTSPTVINYACEDSVASLMIHEKHYAEVADQFLFKVEMALMPVLIEMEAEGMLLDWAEISRKAQEVAQFRDQMNEEIQAELSNRLGEQVSVLLSSPKQLAEILFDRLGLPIKKRSEKTNAPSTGEEALRAIAKTDPIIKRILEWREVSKLYSSYLHKYETQLNYAGTGRAHPNHNQMGALTGRFSVDQVSYQQWPKPYEYELDGGQKFYLNFRDLLIAPEGFRIVGFDFSQVELRVLAAMANEQAMLEAFRSGVDIHRATASNMMGVPIEDITKKQRAVGKTLNFAVVYGSGANNIADMLTTPDAPVTEDDAKKMLENYFGAFKGLRRWMDERVAEGRQQGYVHTPFGRKFTVWEYRDHRDWIRAKGDRMCVNAPVQGGAADYLKIGMVRAQAAIKKAGLQDKIRLIMTIHDALEFYVHESVSTQEVIDLIQPQVSFDVPTLPVQIKADWHEGMRWGSVVEIKQDRAGQITHYEIEDVDERFEAIVDAYRYMEQREDARYAAEHGEPEEDDTPMALAPEPDKPAAPADLELEPSWLHAPEYYKDKTRITVKVLDMPDEDQWSKFQKYLADRPGSGTVVFSTPQGDLEMDGQHDLAPDDQPILSLMLGGAQVIFESAVDDATKLAEGVAL